MHGTLWTLPQLDFSIPAKIPASSRWSSLGAAGTPNLPFELASMQSCAANSAILVSRSNFLRFAGGSSGTTHGISLGQVSFLKGFGALVAPGIGLSLALEKLERFGAQ